MQCSGPEFRFFNDNSALRPHHPHQRRHRWEGPGSRGFTYRSVFILQAGAGDGAAIQKDPALGRGHLPTPLKLVVQQRVLPEDEPPRLPVVDNVTLRTNRRALQ